MNPDETDEQRAARFDRMWDWYFALVDSGWRPADDGRDLQFDVETERRDGWSVP